MGACFLDRKLIKEIEIPVFPGIGWDIMGERITGISFDEKGFEFETESDTDFCDPTSPRATAEEMDDQVRMYTGHGWKEEE